MNVMVRISVVSLLWASLLAGASPILGETSEILQESAEQKPAQESAAAQTSAGKESAAAQTSASQDVTAAANEKKSPGLTRGNNTIDGNAYHYGGTKKIHFDDPLKLIKEGKIGVTHQYNDAKHLARAFKEDFSDDDFGWVSKKCPQMLWCRFDDSKVPAGITFLPVQAKAQANEFHVTKWQFVSSKDSKCNQNSTWEVICEDLSGSVFKGRWARKGCFAGKEIQEQFKCFGIRVIEGVRHPGKYNSVDTFQLTNINMYEKIAVFNRF